MSYYFRCLGWEWELTDVTLAWRDRQQVEAHKVILALASQMLDILCQILYAQYCMLNIVCNVFLWLFGLAPSNPGLQELNNQLRYGQYHLPMGVDGLASLAQI